MSEQKTDRTEKLGLIAVREHLRELARAVINNDPRAQMIAEAALVGVREDEPRSDAAGLHHISPALAELSRLMTGCTCLDDPQLGPCTWCQALKTAKDRSKPPDGAYIHFANLSRVYLVICSLPNCDKTLEGSHDIYHSALNAAWDHHDACHTTENKNDGRQEEETG